MDIDTHGSGEYGDDVLAQAVRQDVYKRQGVYEATQGNNIWQADVLIPQTAVEGWSRMYAYDL